MSQCTLSTTIIKKKERKKEKRFIANSSFGLCGGEEAEVYRNEYISSMSCFNLGQSSVLFCVFWRWELWEVILIR
jgi:hypothetical protein